MTIVRRLVLTLFIALFALVFVGGYGLSKSSLPMPTKASMSIWLLTPATTSSTNAIVAC
jgi:hypothetical protein